MIYFSFLCCTDNGKKTRDAARPQPATAAVLASEPASGYQAIRLNIASIKFIGADGAADRTLAVARTCDLQAPGRISLAAADPLAGQRYQEAVIILAPRGHSVTLAEGGEHPLHIPGQLRNGIPVPAPGGPLSGDAGDITFVFDAARSVHPSRTGGEADTRYTLWPHVWAATQADSGSITGKVTDAAGAPQPGITVTAQAEAGGGRARIAGIPAMKVLRTVRTDGNGSFKLDLLPRSRGRCHLVSLPAAGRGFVTAEAGEALALEQRPLQQGARVLPVEQSGTLTGILHSAPGADEYDEVDILQSLPAGAPGAGRKLFVVRSLVPDTVVDRCGFELALPPGEYRARHNRFRVDARGSIVQVRSTIQPCQVESGMTTALAFLDGPEELVRTGPEG